MGPLAMTLGSESRGLAWKPTVAASGTWSCSLWYLRLQVRGLDYAAVLDMVIGAARPVTLHFERRGAKPQGALAVRMPHQEWTPPPAAEPPAASAQE
jgi:hypothetical protein